MFSRVLLAGALVALPGLLVPTLASSAPATSAPVAAPTAYVGTGDAIVERRVIGHSVRGRPIRAWRLGNPDATRKAVIISTMHGDERQTRQILESLRDGRPITGIDMWVIPGYNPDGYARHTRKNARGVDLNRNFPYRWRDLDGRYESGRRAASEPETRAVMAFLRDIRPRWVVSFHQPLHGVDIDTKWPRFAGRLSDELNLPRKSFTCGGVCHGTMTMWFNHNFPGAAITVEYGEHPSAYRMQTAAPRQLLRALYARRT